jgi:hypothetical protein
VSHRRTIAPALVLATTVLLLGGPVATAQAGASIHVDVENGVHAGVHEATTSEPCFASDDYTNDGADVWQLSFEDDAAEPSSFTLRTGFGADLLLVGWSNGDYTTTAFELTSEATAPVTTLTIVADLDADYYAAADDPDPVHVTVVVQCHDLIDQRAPEATPESTQPPAAFAVPTPRVQGSPAPGSTVIDVSLDFGPWAGSYRSWTLDEACFVDEGAWMVTIHDGLAIPSSVTLLAVEATTEDPSMGLFSASFGSVSEPTAYETSRDATFVLDPSGRATVEDFEAMAFLADGTRATGSLGARIECATMVTGPEALR